MRRLTVLVGCGVLAAACTRPAPGPAPAASLVPGALRGHNVLLVTIDTLRRDRVGAYGTTGGLTPTIDRLAARGVRYAHAFSHAPLTLPAHTSILTGRTPVGHGVHLNGASRLGDGIPTLATVLKQAGYRTGAFVGAFVLDARYGLTRGFDRYDDRYPPPSNAASFAFAERRGSEVVAAAGDWITRTAATPWFAWVHLFDPHTPYDAPAEYRSGRTPYDAEVAYADAMVGRLLERLGAPVLEQTLVVVTADHGESLGEHGETTHGLFAYDATLAVPLLLSGGGVPAAVVEAPVGHADILPTVTDLLGLPAPAGVDGRSMIGALPTDRPLYFEALEAHLTRDWAPLTGVVAGGWKYVHLPGRELYDRGSDQAETRNVATQQGDRVDTMERTRLQLSSQPAAPAPAARLDPEAERRLRSLGYAASSVAMTPNPGTAREYGDADDPKGLVGLSERFNSALEAFSNGRQAEALETFEAILEDRPDFTTARTSAATVLLSLGKAAQASSVLRQAPAAQRASADLQAKLGVALREAGDLRGAALALERAKAAGYANPELLNDLGVVYARLGRPAEARAQFAALVALDPDAADAWNNLGVLEMTARNPAEAARAFRQAVDADPSRGDAWEGLGAALVGTDRAGAAEAWKQAERLQPRNYDLLFNLGMVLAGGPTPAEARPYLTRFLREAPAASAADRRAVEAQLRRIAP